MNETAELCLTALAALARRQGGLLVVSDAELGAVSDDMILVDYDPAMSSHMILVVSAKEYDEILSRR